MPTASWPFFGRVPQRTHYLGGPIEDLDPPFNILWHINTHALIEFPPAIYDGVAYLVNKYGNVYAVRLKDKKILWTRIVRKRLHGAPIDVTGPAYYGGRVYVAEIGGALIALNAKTGKIDWKRDLGRAPRVLAADRRQDALHRHRLQARCWRSTPPTATRSGNTRRARRSRRAPHSTKAASTSATTRAACWR